MRMPEGWPEAGPYVGQEAVMRQWEQQRETWDADSLELIGDFIDATEPSCGQIHLARRRPRPRLQHGGHRRIHGARRQDSDHRVVWDHAEALEAVGRSE